MKLLLFSTFKLLLSSFLLILLSFGLVMSQTWDGTTTSTKSSNYNTSIQLTQIDKGSHHGILFNSYLSPTRVNGDLQAVGNTKHSFAAGSFTSGAGAIMFLGNGGRMDFLISEISNGAGQNITWGIPKMAIQRNGNVGIGTTNPGTFRLAVSGKIAANEEVRVFSAGTINFPDYVFDPAYKLPNLFDTELFVKANRHLPDVPSAAEVERDGMSLNEMNIILLKKVEELTLYMIEMKKENKELQERIEKIENEK